MTGPCRGCGGTGLDHNLSPRVRQLALEEIVLLNEHKGGTGVAYLRISEEPLWKARLQARGSLTDILREIERLGAIGYVAESPPDPAWACEWCGGTGVPQLTEPYLRMAVSA